MVYTGKIPRSIRYGWYIIPVGLPPEFRLVWIVSIDPVTWEKGFRQEDAISQALLVLCIEKQLLTCNLRLSRCPFVNLFGLDIFPDHLLSSPRSYRVGHTSPQITPSRRSEAVWSEQHPWLFITRTIEPFPCCRPIYQWEAETRTVYPFTNMTALWSENVKSRTTCHSSALSSRAELHALSSTMLLKKIVPPILLGRGRFALVQYMQPISIDEIVEIHTVCIIVFAVPPHAPRVDVIPHYYIVRPKFRADIPHAIEVRTDGLIAFEAHRHNANPAISGFYYGSFEVFVDEGLILFDIHATVGSTPWIPMAESFFGRLSILGTAAARRYSQHRVPGPTLPRYFVFQPQRAARL
ncbi:hypothetical protein EVAR_35694_1 [Eumeta japonica]|uniref:Uncharacterized protein n=1 Tax=Eumeta variegata TaxID=151549 RepID=A0A4C1VEG8_EUMVA|nr:hypothetical protein EVAR_35694_1 [Eumeta japonica]